jgi:hypothetical protein
MSLITEEMQALIGVPGPKLTAPSPLGPDELRRFVQGVMEGNPVHWDPQAAAASRYGEVVATPLFPMHSTTRRSSGSSTAGPRPSSSAWRSSGTSSARSRSTRTSASARAAAARWCS